MRKLILASQSPRRKEIMSLLGFDFEVIVSPFVEVDVKAKFSYDFVENLAFNKSIAVKPLVNNGEVIIGADTVVVINDNILGKPANFDKAFDMLKMLSGKVHKVVTSVCCLDTISGNYLVRSDTSYVGFRKLKDELIQFYINNYSPFDKAGGYGIQEFKSYNNKEFEYNYFVKSVMLVLLELLFDFDNCLL